MARVSRVLLPTAFSVLSRRAAEYASLLVPDLAEVHVVHVVPHTALFLDPGLPALSTPAAGPSTAELLADARARLDAFVREVFPGRPGVTPAALAGGVVEGLLGYISAHRIELVVMGTHADGMLKRIIWGSVSKCILEGAPCPVLLVPVRDAPRV